MKSVVKTRSKPLGKQCSSTLTLCYRMVSKLTANEWVRSHRVNKILLLLYSTPHVSTQLINNSIMLWQEVYIITMVTIVYVELSFNLHEQITLWIYKIKPFKPIEFYNRDTTEVLFTHSKHKTEKLWARATDTNWQFEIIFISIYSLCMHLPTARTQNFRLQNLLFLMH